MASTDQLLKTQNKLAILNNTYFASQNASLLGSPSQIVLPINSSSTSTQLANLGTTQFFNNTSLPQGADNSLIYINNMFQLTNTLFTSSGITLQNDSSVTTNGFILSTLNNGTATPNTSAPNMNIFYMKANSYTPVAYSSTVPGSTGSGSPNFTDPTNTNNLMITDINLMELLLTNATTVPASLTSIPVSFYFLQAIYAWYSLLDNTNWQLLNAGQPVTFYVPDLVPLTSDINTIITSGPTGQCPGGSSSSTANQIASKYNSAAKTAGNNVQVSFTQVTVQLDKNNNLTAPSNQLFSQKLATGLTGTNNAPLGGDIATLMNYFLNYNSLIYPQINTFNPFVARRLMHLYIILLNLNIALSFNSIDVNGNGNYTAAIYKLLEATNINVTDINGGIFTQIVEAVKGRINEYNQNEQQLTAVNNQVASLQSAVTQDSNSLSATMQYQKTIKIYQYVAIGILIIIAIGSGLVYGTPMEYNRKLALSGLLIIISLISAFILQYLLNNTLVKENFTSTGVYSAVAGNISTIYTAQNISGITAYQSAIGNQVNLYLDNSILLTNTLDSYHLYGNINNSLIAQNAYYNDAKASLQMKDANLKDVNNINYINQIKYGAIMNFAITLSLIISIFVTLHISLENYPSLRYYLFVIMIICVLIAIGIFLLEISRPVRTHPKEIYWGADISKLN